MMALLNHNKSHLWLVVRFQGGTGLSDTWRSCLVVASTYAHAVWSNTYLSDCIELIQQNLIKLSFTDTIPDKEKED